MKKFILLWFMLFSLSFGSTKVSIVTDKDNSRFSFDYTVNISLVNFKIVTKNNVKNLEIYEGNQLIRVIENIRFNSFSIIKKSSDFSYIDLKIE